MDPLISEKELKKQIVKVSDVTWWTWRRTGRLDGLPAITIGAAGRRYYRREDVDRWLADLAASHAA